MAWQDWATLASLFGVVLAIWFGRRRGRQRFQASIAAAKAEAHSAAVAELSAQLVNKVQIINGQPLPGESSDPLVAALRRLSVEHTRSVGSADDYRAASDDLDNIVAAIARDNGRSVQRDNDEQLASQRFAGGGDRSGSSHGVVNGEAMT